MADIIQINYDEMEEIGSLFGTQSDLIASLFSSLKNEVTELKNSWEGKGADAFFNEMENDIFPVLQRLEEGLSEGQQVVSQIVQIMMDAEEEAAQQVALWDEGDGGPGGAGGTAGESVGSAEGGAGSELPTPLGTEQVFNEDYYDSLIDYELPGAGSPTLIDAMNTLSGNPTQAEVDVALAQIAEARDLPLNQVEAQYERYLELRGEAERVGGQNGQEAIPGLSGFHDDFMGSDTQLRYGKIVGDTLGIDPVFGSLLNPTGGLVGPGNTALDLGDRAVSYHGAVHDAAGYLFNYHDQGPGYNYLGLEDRPTDSPFTGQESGIAYWNEKFGVGGIEGYLTETAGTLIGEYEDSQSLLQVAGTGIGMVASDGAEYVVDQAAEVVDSTIETAGEVIESVGDAAGEVVETVDDAVDWFTDLF